MSPLTRMDRVYALQMRRKRLAIPSNSARGRKRRATARAAARAAAAQAAVISTFRAIKASCNLTRVYE